MSSDGAAESSEQSQHVGPIIFANRIARTQLLNHGEVVTFRESDRTTGDTWWRESRTGPKKGDVEVSLIKAADPWHYDVLEPYANLSGFESPKAWRKAIYGLNDGPTTGYLYGVTAKEGTCGRCGEERPLPTNEFCPDCMRAEAFELYTSREAKGHAR